MRADRINQGVSKIDAIILAEEAAARVAHELSRLPQADAEDVYCEARLAALELLLTCGGKQLAPTRLYRQVRSRVAAKLRTSAQWPGLKDEAQTNARHDKVERLEFDADLDLLPPLYAAVIRLRYLEGAEWQGICDMLGIAEPFAHYLARAGLEMLAGNFSRLSAQDFSGIQPLDEEEFLREARAALTDALGRGLPAAVAVLGAASASAVHAAAQKLCQCVRFSDVVGWYEGWIAIVAPRTGEDGAEALLARLLAIAEECTGLRWRAGHAMAPGDGKVLATLLQVAVRRAA